ncbi:alkaline phosphatase family protein [Chloroflexota bacterium]
MSKVLMLGIDSLDSRVLSTLEQDLPNFRKLKKQSPDIKLSSIFPPDSVPAWVTIYTGMNPARHGVLNFINPADRAGKVLLTEIDNSYFSGKAFWDIAATLGKRVCLVLPYAVYPTYPVNGTMACRVLKVMPRDFPIQFFPPSASEKYQVPSSSLNLFHGFPSKRKLTEFIASCRERTLAEAELGIQMAEGEEWDLLFIYFSALDAIQHAFWNCFDESDPTYILDSPYHDVIKDFYILCDDVVGRFMALAKHDTHIIVVSDHGHGTRPTKTLNINEILRRGGFLTPKSQKMSNINPLYRTGWIKKSIPKLINQFGMGYHLTRLLHRFTIWKKIFASPSFIDWKRTLAYVTDLSAIKSYSYGGVRVNSENLGRIEYEEMRSLVIKALSQIKEPDTGENLVQWVCTREEVYSGKYIEKYPDILFLLKDEYGAGWEIGKGLVSPSPIHDIQPGSHKGDTPVLLISNCDRECAKRGATLMDIAPTLLHLMEIDGDFGFDGESILE